jgi:hypothetical protein
MSYPDSNPDEGGDADHAIRGQEQLDAPADHLESNADEVVPLSGARGFTSCTE